MIQARDTHFSDVNVRDLWRPPWTYEYKKGGGEKGCRQVKQIGGLPSHWEDFISCLLMHMLFPFLPLFIELLLTQSVDRKSLYLFAAMYPVSIGISSYNRLQQQAAFVIGIIFAVVYGVMVGGGPQMQNGEAFAAWSIGAIFLIHLVERYNRHVVDRTPFHPVVARDKETR